MYTRPFFFFLFALRPMRVASDDILVSAASSLTNVPEKIRCAYTNINPKTASDYSAMPIAVKLNNAPKLRRK